MRIISRLGSGSLRAVCLRTRMVGFDAPHCCYDVYVPADDIPPARRDRIGYFVTRSDWRGFLVLPVNAFLPDDFDGLPSRSEVRLDVFRNAKRAADAWALACALQAFPELASVGKLPDLWLQHDAESSLVVVREPAQVAA